MVQNRKETDFQRKDTQPVLEIENLRKEFQSITALDGVDFSIREGEIVGLVGPNGAGKTTVFNCIMGAFPITAGNVYLNGNKLTNKRTSSIVQTGLSRTFQIPRVFPSLSVRDNMRVNQSHAQESMFRTMYHDTDETVDRRINELLEFVELEDHADKLARELSTGQKKILNLVSTLLRDPDVVLLDEPTAGVNPALVDDITESIEELNEQGRTFFVIEHDMDVIREITDYTYVISAGQNLTQGPPRNALQEPEVLEAYFGE